MSTPNPADPSLWPSELGVTQAARLAGMPEVTLRLHVDQGKVLGVRRTESGRRMISRQGLLAYLQARGLDASRRGGLDAPSASRVLVSWGGPMLEGRLERVRGRSLEISGIVWQGPLPDPEAAVSFRIEGGALDGVGGEAQASWILWKGGRIDLVLRSVRDVAGERS